MSRKDYERKREIPDAMKPRRIEVGRATPASANDQLEASEGDREAA